MDAMMIGAPFGLGVLIALGILLAVMNHLSQWKGALIGARYLVSKTSAQKDLLPGSRDNWRLLPRPPHYR
jgi:hypothetical protein